MENTNSYFIAGLSFLLAIFTCVTFVLFMNSNKNDFDEIYYVQTNNVPAGVRKNSPVNFLGVPAGIVREVNFADYNQSKIEIKLAMLSNLQISKDSIVQVHTQLIGGGATLNITRGSGIAFSHNEKKMLYLDNYFEDFSNKALKMSEKINTSIDKLNTILGDDDSGLIQASKKILSKDNIKNFSKTLDNLQITTNNIAKLNFDNLFKELSNLSYDIRKVVKNFHTISDDLMNKSKNGEFDFRTILQDSLSEFTLSAKAMRRTLNEVDNALFRLEQNPYGFFFNDTKEKK